MRIPWYSDRVDVVFNKIIVNISSLWLKFDVHLMYSLREFLWWKKFEKINLQSEFRHSSEHDSQFTIKISKIENSFVQIIFSFHLYNIIYHDNYKSNIGISDIKIILFTAGNLTICSLWIPSR